MTWQISCVRFSVRRDLTVIALHTYSGGAHKSLRGYFFFYEIDLRLWWEEQCMPFNKNTAIRKFMRCSVVAWLRRRLPVNVLKSTHRCLLLSLRDSSSKADIHHSKIWLFRQNAPSQRLCKIQTLQIIPMLTRTSQRRLRLLGQHSILLQERIRLVFFCLRDKRKICHCHDELHHAYIACSWRRIYAFERAQIRKHMPRAVSIWSWRTFWEQIDTNITGRNIQTLLSTIFTSSYKEWFLLLLKHIHNHRYFEL